MRTAFAARCTFVSVKGSLGFCGPAVTDHRLFGRQHDDGPIRGEQEKGDHHRDEQSRRRRGGRRCDRRWVFAAEFGPLPANLVIRLSAVSSLLG